jgi:hypothetical protein
MIQVVALCVNAVGRMWLSTSPIDPVGKQGSVFRNVFYSRDHIMAGVLAPTALVSEIREGDRNATEVAALTWRR